MEPIDLEGYTNQMFYFQNDTIKLYCLMKNYCAYILINLGSGIQEPLGLYLNENLNFKPGIICTGAAIAFFITFASSDSTKD